MTEPTSTDHDRGEEPCVIHHPNVDVSDIYKKFTPKTWDTFLKCMDIWKDHPHTENGKTAIKFLHFQNCDLQSAFLPALPVPTNCGFHRKCYQRFTNATRIKWLRKPRCDSVSAFFLKGKVKALRHIQGDAESAKSLKMLGDSFTVDEVNFLAVEKFVYKLYGQMDATSVNDVRFDMFKKANRMESTMPPNNDALRQHILRANFQARIYKLSLMKNQDLPSPSEHGWIFDDGHLAIHWMSLPPAPESIIELGNCSCKKNKCQLPNAGDSCCVSFGLPCTDLCQCKGCENISQMILEIEEDLDTDEDDQME